MLIWGTPSVRPPGSHSLRGGGDAPGNPVGPVPSLGATSHRRQGRKEEVFQPLCWIELAFATRRSDGDLGCQELGHTPPHPMPSLPQPPQQTKMPGCICSSIFRVLGNMVKTWQEEEAPVDSLGESWRAPFPGGRKHLGLVSCGQSKAGISARAELREENQP